MKKYNLICPIRKINPIKAMIKANQANRTYSNIVDRNFNQGKSKLVLVIVNPKLSHIINLKMSHLSMC